MILFSTSVSGAAIQLVSAYGGLPVDVIKGKDLTQYPVFPLKTVSQRLGHANATVTLNTYAHVMSGDDERAADLLEELMRNQLGKKGEKKPK